MIDYNNEIKETIQKFFDPKEGNRTTLTTNDVYQMFLGILPKDMYNHDDIYQVLKDLGYKQIFDKESNTIRWVLFQK